VPARTRTPQPGGPGGTARRPSGHNDPNNRPHPAPASTSPSRPPPRREPALPRVGPPLKRTGKHKADPPPPEQTPARRPEHRRRTPQSHSVDPLLDLADPQDELGTARSALCLTLHWLWGGGRVRMLG